MLSNAAHMRFSIWNVSVVAVVSVDAAVVDAVAVLAVVVPEEVVAVVAAVLSDVFFL